MTLFQLLPAIAYAACLFVVFRHALSPADTSPGNWRWPAALSAIFLAFTLYQIATDGILMFWTNHSVNATGNQVWFDLLMSVSMAFILLLSRARALNMAIIPWAIFVASTASIGLFAMWARVLYLEEKQSFAQPA